MRFGSIVGAGILVLTLHGKNVGYDAAINWIGQNGWGDGYLGGYTMTVAVLTELATFIFVSVLLAVTARKGAGALAGLGCSSSSPSLGDMPLALFRNGRESANSPSLKGTPCLSTDAERAHSGYQPPGRDPGCAGNCSRIRYTVFLEIPRRRAVSLMFPAVSA